MIELHNTLPEADNLPNNPTEYVKTVKKLDNHFIPRQNKRYERHIFRSCSQNETESTGQYVSQPWQLATTCEFHDTQDEIVDQVIDRCNSKKLRKRLLKERDLTLDKLLEIALVIEAADHQSVKYESTRMTTMSTALVVDHHDILRVEFREYRPPKSWPASNVEMTT